MGAVFSEYAMKLLSLEAQKRVREEGRRIVDEYIQLSDNQKLQTFNR